MLQCQYLFSLKVALPLCNKQDRFMVCYCMPVLSTNWLSVGDLETWWYILASFMQLFTIGDVAQMVERSLSMWGVGGSIPPVSKIFKNYFGTSARVWMLQMWQRKNLVLVWQMWESKKYSQSAGFEPALPEGNWFLVSRLNHSATTADRVPCKVLSGI